VLSVSDRTASALPDGGVRHRTHAATTGEAGVRTDLDPVEAAARREAHRLMHRLHLEPAWEAPLRRGGSDLVSVRWDGRGGDIDADRLIEPVMLGPHIRDDQIFVRRPMTRTRSVMLLIDVSGSMKGERLHTAAAAIGSLFGELTHDAVGVTAFWSDAAVVVELGDRREPSDVLEQVLAIRARGLTNIGFGLSSAADELTGWPAEDARIILLSDCVHNAGPDPRPLAVGGPRIDVLLDDSEEHDERVGRDLARVSGGYCRTVGTAAQVPVALAELFED
jgi:Mg-chelatase subunit ChlD